MTLAKNFEAQQIESKWLDYWSEHALYESKPNQKEAHTIVIPPPNVTGILHMGHMLNNTIQDVLIRRARQEGKNACWVPGTDHASIATEAKVLKMLAEKGIQKKDLTREAFLTHALEWKDKHGGIILEQLKRLGCSCDWSRTKFTMDKEMTQAVIKTFVDLYEKGFIYKGIRMVNWDPEAQTAVSDEEVIHKEVDSSLYHIKYQIKNSSECIVIATTRPETLLGDTAIAIHPKDKRFKQHHRKTAIVPLIGREIPIILDEYVDKEFGTGALKITPAHDINDYELGLKHNLNSIDILNDDGTLNEKAEILIGEDRFIARKKIAKLLKQQNALIKTEPLKNKVGFSERTDAVIEPKLSLQWFVKMDELSKPALENVMNDNIKFHPPKFKNSYKHWMENIKDWCISRQLWWGQQIPAFYYGDGANDFVVAENKTLALEKAQKKTKKPLKGSDLKQDPDVLDTWFSSWLWPISVFGGIKDKTNKEIQYYYPTQDLVTAPEIMFFWVARMIMAGYAFMGEKPFENVYYTGIVRDKQRRKMSKSLGNSPDPIKLMEKYGTDAVRVGMLLSSPAGNDLLFDENLCAQGRNFSNKIWNAYRLICSWNTNEEQSSEAEKMAIDWMTQRIHKIGYENNALYSQYRLSDVLMNLYKLIWDDFCALFLELIKPGFEQTISEKTTKDVKALFENILKQLHPFMPFITEELWSNLESREKGESISTAAWPKFNTTFNQKLSEDFILFSGITSHIRTIRKEKNIGFKTPIPLYFKENNFVHPNIIPLLKKINNLSAFDKYDEKASGLLSFIEQNQEYFIKNPVGDLSENTADISKIQEEINYTKGFLASVEKKLANERFVQNAPEKVVELEQKKKEDALQKLKLLKKQLSTCN